MDEPSAARAKKSAVKTGMNGGASSDAGTDHRAGVAAYLAAAALHNSAVAEDGASIPVSIDLETDDATDDIRCEMLDGSNWYIQAKRTGSLGKPFLETMRQWARQDLRPRDQVVMASERFVGTLGSAADVLTYRRHRRGQRPNERATAGLDEILERARKIDASLPRRIRESGRFLVCNTGDSGAERRIAETWLESVIGRGQGAAAFDALKMRFVSAAKRQERTSVDDWIDALRSAGHPVAPDRNGTGSQQRALQHRVLRSYRRSIAAVKDRLDLTTVVPGMPVIDGPNLLGEWEIHRDGGNRPAGERVAFVARRIKRLLIVGLPGVGKSTMLAQLAATWADDVDAPVPVLVRFADIAAATTRSDDVTLDLLLRLAAQRVNSEQPRDVVETLHVVVQQGQAAFLIDGLDESFKHLGPVLSGVSALIRDLPPETGWVITSRNDAAQLVDTMGLQMLKTSLLFRRKARDIVRQILLYEARLQRVPEQEVDQWIANRSTWYPEDDLGRSDSLVDTPMHVALLASQAARNDVTSRSVVDLLPTVLAQRARQLTALEIGGEHPGGWDQDLRDGMALQVIIAIGHALADVEAIDEKDAEVVAATALQGWQLSPLITRNIAKQLIWYWDERAAVLDRERGVVRARSRRWADVADAMWLQEQSDDVVAQWLHDALEGEGRLDAIALAFSLAPSLLGHLRVAVRSSGNRRWNATEALLAWLNGRDLEDLDVDGIQQDLLAAAGNDDEDKPVAKSPLTSRLKAASRSRDHILTVAAGLPISTAQRGNREARIDAFSWLSEHSRRAVHALTAIADAEAEGAKALPSSVTSFIAETPVSPAEKSSSKVNPRTGVFEVSSSRVDTPTGIGEIAFRIARFVPNPPQDMTDWLFSAARQSAMSDYLRIHAILNEKGIADPTPFWSGATAFLAGFNRLTEFFTYDWMLHPLSAAAMVDDARTLWRTEQVANLVQVLEAVEPHGSRSVLAAHESEVRGWLELMLRTVGGDRAKVAQEARYLLEAESAPATTSNRRALLLLTKNPFAAEPDPAKRFDDGDWDEAERLLASDFEWITDSAASLFLKAERPLAEEVSPDVPGRSAYAAHNTVLIQLGLGGEPPQLARFLAEGRPAARHAVARIAQTHRDEPRFMGIVDACQADTDWTVRVFAGARQATAELASSWSCPDCEHVNIGIEASPCTGCGRESRPNAR
jgi:hypothetical protein